MEAIINVTTVANQTLPTLGQQCFQDFLLKTLFEFLQMFYIVFPSQHPPESDTDVYNYEVNLIPMASVFVIIEQVVRLLQHKELTRIQDLVTNLGSSVIFLFARILFLGVIIHLYIYLYDNYRIVDMGPETVWSWLVSLLLVEFVYYWTHRALHEFNILWAAHQFHHMAEDLNVSTAVRDSVVDLILYDIFPLPLSFIIHPQILIVHMQFSLIYQIWLHNSVVPNLGFLEYIINTPRQHLVHHGKNPYCIDKNYGALLMIWDRMFGTYQREKPEDELVFGVVSPTPATFDPLSLQFGYYRDVYNKFNKMDNFSDKMSALLKGPGWSPGKARLGSISDVPEPDRNAPKYSYDPETPLWVKMYIVIHSFIVLMAFYFIGHHSLIRFSYVKAMVAMVYIIVALTSFGFIFDSRKFASVFEVVRCGIYFLFDYYIVVKTPWVLNDGEEMVSHVLINGIRIIHVVSIIFWVIRWFTVDDYSLHAKQSANLNACELTTNGEKKEVNGEKKEANGDNIELAKKIVSKRESRKFNVQHLVASILFILFAFIVMDILYFVKVDSCTQLLNEFKK